ncbi:hypothetical protein [Sphingomonas aquatilis]
MTIPVPLPFTMSGFDREEDAQWVASHINGAFQAVSSYINIERLAGVSIAGNYAQALADVDRGFENLNPLVRSDNDTMRGVAMAVPVVRDGVLKKHIVFDAEAVLPIVMCKPETDDYRRAVYVVAHECGHVADLRDLDTAFPDVLLKERIGGIAAVIEPHASALWSEYTASRQSAIFWRDQGDAYVEVATSAAHDGQEEASEAIAVYRFHADIDTLIEETFEPATRAVRTCAYVVGHLDAFGDDMPAGLRQALADADLLEVVEEMRDGLRQLWERRGKWESRDEFAFMAVIIRRALAIAGLYITDAADGGARIDVPFTEKNP